MQPYNALKQPTSASDSRFNQNLEISSEQKVQLSYNQRSRGNYDILDE